MSYKAKQIVEILYQGRWVQGTLVELPQGENECYIVDCGLAQLAARPEEEIRPTRKYHVMTNVGSNSEYRRGTLLEEFYSFDNKCAIKIARQYWPAQKATLWAIHPPESGMLTPEFCGNVDEKRAK